MAKQQGAIILAFYFSDPVPLFLVYTAFYFCDPVPLFLVYTAFYFSDPVPLLLVQDHLGQAKSICSFLGYYS